MTTYNHMYDIAFSVSGAKQADPEEVPITDIRIAIVKRINSLDDFELREAIGYADTYEEEE